MNANTSSAKIAQGTGEAWRPVLAAVAARIEASGRACDREGAFVADNLQCLHDLGFFALGVPEGLGGGGAAYADVAAMLRELGSLDGATALTLSMHTHQVMVAEWKRRVQGAATDGLLRKVANDGLRIVSSGGSDWLPGSGRAEKVEGGFRIFAHKVFASGAQAGGIINTSAVHDDADAGPTVLHFALPLAAEGIVVGSSWDALGMRGSGSQDIRIDGVFVADADIAARRPPMQWHPLFHLISLIAFPLIYSVYAGVADGARKTALAISRDRPHDAAARLTAGELENAHAMMDLAHAALVRLGAEASPSPETTARVMTQRALVARAALEVGSKAMDVAGGAGFHRAAGLEQRFRDLQGARYHPLQDAQQRLQAGGMALGEGIDGRG